MSSPDRARITRRALILGAGAALAGCALTPAYGPGGTGTALTGRVALRAPDDVDSFALNRRLSERLGPETAAAYALNYRLTTASVAQGITPDEVTTRYSLNGTADFALSDIASGKVITQGRVSSFTSYSAVGTTIATLSAERDAHERLMVMLADQIVTRLLATGPRP
ncbi:MAG: LPS assembly lipoprotein LptE [Paracoccus sp. (in: a-proteobacteria)]|nr:LPS assembly lipoprotein LptE [Paracoccus sp. (in: a-proteobacteria)]